MHSLGRKLRIIFTMLAIAIVTLVWLNFFIHIIGYQFLHALRLELQTVLQLIFNHQHFVLNSSYQLSRRTLCFVHSIFMFFCILVILVVWFFSLFFRPAHLALQNVNKDYIIFSYFHNFVAKSDKKPKTKNGMNKTLVSKMHAHWSEWFSPQMKGLNPGRLKKSKSNSTPQNVEFTVKYTFHSSSPYIDDLNAANNKKENGTVWTINPPIY